MASYERSYGTARTLFRSIELISWLMVAVGIVTVLGSLSQFGNARGFESAMLAVFGIGGGVVSAFAGIIAVAFVQSSSANVDQAEMTRDQLQIARLTFEKTFGTTQPASMSPKESATKFSMSVPN
jgi:hypothetical protein